MTIKKVCFVILMVLQFSIIWSDAMANCVDNWCSIENQATTNYPNLQYKLPHNNCPKLEKAVVLLHGSIVYEADNAFFGSQKLISDPELEALFNFLSDNCALLVLPNSSLIVPELTITNPFFGSQRVIPSIMRWDTNNSAGTNDKQKLINLLTDLRETYSISKTILMGGSSGAVMAHYVVSDFRARTQLSGLVIAEGISANQLQYLDRELISEELRYFFLQDTFAIGDGYYSGKEPAEDDECKKESINHISFLQENRYITPSKFSVDYGFYLDEFREIGFSSKNPEIPTLIVFSTQDSLIPCSLKLKFAESLYDKSSSKGTGEVLENSVNIAQVSGDHGQMVWALKSVGDNLINDINSETLNWVTIGVDGEKVDSSLKLFIQSILNE